MLIPRLQYHLNGYNPEMSITLSMQNQQQHINQLLNTAATATGIVGDVDALLTPIQTSNTMPVRAEHSRERNLWRTNEIMEMLTIMQEIKALEMLSVKTIKSELVFRKVERIMHLRGFRKKSHVQIWTKWKFLKSTYTTSRRNGIIPKMIPQPIYEELHKMLQNANTNCSGRSTSDCGNSATSLDGDDSNSATANNCTNDNESKLVISGVEGGYGVGNKKSLNGCVDGPESDEENGLAHPIFGFRLGLVKQEPADTGYECSSLKEKESTANIQFQTEVKQEIIEADETPSESASPSTHPAADEELQHQPQRQTLPEIMILSRRTTRPTPTANTTTSTSIPNASSIPKANISVSHTQPGDANTTSSTPLPPLRIARFAKIPSSEITTTDSNVNLPPPPLTMNPTSHTLRLNSAYSSGTYTVNGKGNSNNNVLTYTRKFATINPQTVTITAPGHQTTVHPYIRQRQQHQVVVPDLNVAAAPHEHRAPQPFYGFPDGPSTSQQAQQQQVQQIEARKRRLKASLMNTMLPKQMPRAPETLTKPTSRQANLELNSDINDDGLNDSSNEEDNSIYQAPPHQGGAQPISENTEPNQNYLKVLQDMAMSLRQMQREAINEFFKRQMKLAREEHEFQMRQDALLMKAFKEQAQQFQQMNKELMDSVEKRKKRLNKQSQKQFMNKKKIHKRQMQTCASTNTKVLLNGVTKPKVEHKVVLAESKKEVKVLMRNVHAQLELTEDEADDDEQNQYEYDVSEYLQDNNNVSLVRKSGEAQVPPGDTECSEENNITSDPVQIIG